MKQYSVEEVYDRFFDEQRLERFRRRLPLYRREEAFQDYDIVRAQFLLHLLRRQAEPIEVEPLAKLYGFWPRQQFFFFTVDRAGAINPRIKLTRPLIAIRGQRYPVIDGLHRLYRAAHAGQATLPCLFLLPQEAWYCTRLSL